MTYAFQLGHQPHISIVEIETVLRTKNIDFTSQRNNEYLLIRTEDSLPCIELAKQLGGTLAILEMIDTSTKDLEKAIAVYLDTIQPEGKIHFSVHGSRGKKLALAAKKQLKSEGRSVRYVEAKNTATILHNNLVEKQSDIHIIEGSLFVTRAIQSFEDFTKRDYARPGIDSKSGMLPPKLARIMVNLTGKNTDAVLLDPFCGSGTLLVEAMTLGYTTIVGSDLSEKAIEDSQKNVEWMKEEMNSAINTDVFVYDAQELNGKIKHGTIDAIASEPYMGKPLKGNESTKFLERQAEDLGELFINTFSSFKDICSPEATIIFIIPRFRHNNDWVVIDCVDQIKKLGFHQVPFNEKNPTLLYWRQDQHVGREIFKFKLT